MRILKKTFEYRLCKLHIAAMGPEAVVTGCYACPYNKGKEALQSNNDGIRSKERLSRQDIWHLGFL